MSGTIPNNVLIPLVEVQLQKNVLGSRDGSTKEEGNKGRLVATNVLEHPLLHPHDAGPSFHFGISTTM